MRLENCPRTSTILGDFSYVSLEVVKKKKVSFAHCAIFQYSRLNQFNEENLKTT